MRKPSTGLALCSILGYFGLTLNSHIIGQAAAFTGTPLVQCSDDYSISDPFRVVNTVEADTSKPGYMLLKFDSEQGIYPFNGIVTVNWANLSSNVNGHFQEQRVNNRYTIAAVPSGPGTIALSIRFNNTLAGGYNKVLPTAQCNATLQVISPQAATSAIPYSTPIPTTPSIVANPIAVSQTSPVNRSATSAVIPLPINAPLSAVTHLVAANNSPIIPLGAVKPLPAAGHVAAPVMTQSHTLNTANSTPAPIVWSAPIPMANNIR